MKKLLDCLYGLLIGVANIIPGASGGTIAVVTGIYDRIISSIANIYKNPINSIKNVLFIGIGVVVGLLLGVVGISKLIEVAPTPTFFLFSGMILGSVPFIYNKVKSKKKTKVSWFILIISLVLIISLPFITNTNENILKFDPISILILFLLGMVGASTMILPGVSGSMVLTIFGYYDSVLNIAKDTLKELLQFQFTTNILLLLAFCVGAVVGIVLFAKAIKYLLDKFFINSFMGILGLVLASSVTIIILAIQDNGTSQLVFAIPTFLIGLLLGYGLTRLEKKGDNMIDFKQYIEKYKDESLQTLIDVLKMDTVLDEYKENDKMPFGKGNYECLNYLLDKAKNDNFTILNVDNYAGHIELGDKGDLVGILGHLDVVPAVGKWSCDPFNPTIKDGKIYARGTLDDKGPVIACYYALKIIKDLNIEMKNKVRIIIGSDEETGSRCMKRYFSKEVKPNYGFSPDADFPVIYGEKGIMNLNLEKNLKLDNIKSIKCGERYNIVCDYAVCEFENLDKKLFDKFLKDKNYQGEVKGNTVIMHGKSAHAMNPSLGINAIYLLMEFINEYYPNELSKFIIDTYDTDGSKLNIKASDEQMGELTINLGLCNYENNELKLGYNLRLPKDNLVDTILNAFNKNDFKISNTYSKSHYVNPESDFVKKLMSVYQEHTNDYESKPFTIGGGTYAREIENAVAFGPMFKDREDVVHQVDEYIFLEDFYSWIELYVKAIYLLVV